MEDNIQKFDVFISYRHDTGFYMAQIMYADLTSKGYSVFMDKTLEHGTYWDKIQSAIRNCSIYIVILFPEDMQSCCSEKSWLSKEAACAVEYEVENIIPILCDNFECPESEDCLSESMKVVLRNHGHKMNKGKSFDWELGSLYDSKCFREHTNPSKPHISAIEFFSQNFRKKSDHTLVGVDMAFHGGTPWVSHGASHDLLVQSLKSGTRWRVLINTVEAAESIGRYMRDEELKLFYLPFEVVRQRWQEMMKLFPDTLEVRECNIPLIHVHHGVRFRNNATNHPYGELHIKYYAYNHTKLDNAYDHTMNSFSKYYPIYSDEFEFLWEKSTPVL